MSKFVRFLIGATLLFAMVFGGFLDASAKAQEPEPPRVSVAISKAKFRSFLQAQAAAGNEDAKKVLADRELFAAVYSEALQQYNLPKGKFQDLVKWLVENKETIAAIITKLLPLFIDDTPGPFGAFGSGGPNTPAFCDPATGVCTAKPAASGPPGSGCPCPANNAIRVSAPTVSRTVTYTYRAGPFPRWRAARQSRGGLFGGGGLFRGNCCGH